MSDQRGPRLTILTVGSRGDVQPYIALGQGLQQAGFAVTLATHEPFKAFIQEHGLGFAPLAGDPRALLTSEQGQQLLSARGNPVKIMRRFAELAEPLIEGLLTDSLQACREAQAVLYALPAYFGYHVADRLGLPSMGAYLQPVNRTGGFASIAFPQSRSHLYNYLTHLLTEQIAWQPFRAVTNRWRREQGLEPEPLRGYFGRLQEQHYPMLYGYSPTVLPKPTDWGEWLHVTGYWFLEQQDWQPPRRLLAFLEKGPPPVYVGFGSMRDRRSADISRIVLQTLRRLDRRAVLLSGWGGLQPAELTADMLMIESAPHDWLFPHMAAVVHHGGAGTTAAGLRAGVPNVIVPFFADQGFWGRRVKTIGAGPAPVPIQRLDVDRLTEALVEALTTAEIRARAAQIGRQIQAEKGVSNAVQAVKQEFFPQPEF